MSVFNVAGYLIEERRRWPVITASPRGQYTKSIQNFERKAYSDEKTVPVAWLDYKVILGIELTTSRLHSFIVAKVSHALNHSAMEATPCSRRFTSGSHARDKLIFFMGVHAVVKYKIMSFEF